MKQRSWWWEQCRKTVWGTFEEQFRKYRHDHVAACVCHSLLWTLVTFSPILFLDGRVGNAFAAVCVALNTAFHAVVDDLKANRFRLNLVTDQALHAMQILATWGAWAWAVRGVGE